MDSALVRRLMAIAAPGSDVEEGANILGDAVQKFADIGNYARYGMPGTEKNRLSVQGLPGGPDPNTSDPETLNRYGAGYLFGQNWGAHPTLAHLAQTGIADPLHLPFDPQLQEQAGKGLEHGLADYQDAQAVPQPDLSALVDRLQKLRGALITR